MFTTPTSVTGPPLTEQATSDSPTTMAATTIGAGTTAAATVGTTGAGTVGTTGFAMTTAAAETTQDVTTGGPGNEDPIEDGGNGIIGAVIGAVVGVVVALALVLVTVVVVIVLKRRTSWKPQEAGDNTYPNAIYGIGV